MARRTIDLDTVQPNGKRGETQRPAFTKVNENFADLYTDLDELETTVQDLRRRQNGRNRLINGDFRFWQRGSSRTVVSPLAVYVPDRFQVVCTGAGQVAVSRRSFDAPAFGVTGFMNCDLTGSTAATEAFVTQPVEGVQTLAGSTVTLSMQAWAATPGCRIGVRFIQTFGTNGSPDVTVRAGVQEIGTAAALRYFTVELPSIAGKTVGANSKLHVIVDFATPGGYGGQLVGQSGSFSLTCMQLEKGATPTDYDMRDDATELMLCQRYYEKSFPLEQHRSLACRHRRASPLRSRQAWRAVSRSPSRSPNALCPHSRSTPTVKWRRPSATGRCSTATGGHAEWLSRCSFVPMDSRFSLISVLA